MELNPGQVGLVLELEQPRASIFREAKVLLV